MLTQVLLGQVTGQIAPFLSGQAGLGNGPSSLTGVLGANSQGSLTASAPFSQSGAGAASNGQGTNAGAGQPVDVTDITSEGSLGAQAEAKATQQAGKTIQQELQAVQKAEQGLQQGMQQDTNSLTQAGTSWTRGIVDTVYNFLPRAGAGLIAIVMIGLGIWIAAKGSPVKARA